MLHQASGELSPSMISDLLEINDSDGGSKENETVFKAVAATAYSGNLIYVIQFMSFV